MHLFASTSPSLTTPQRSAQRSAQRFNYRPNSRTIVGGLLVSAAALASYLTVSGAGTTQQQTMIVASRSIAAGERLDSSSLTTTSIDKKSSLATHGYSSVDSLSGAVAIAPLGEGELIQRSAVLTSSTNEPTREFSFPVDRERALNGDLRAGERVDVLATYGSGSDSTTTVLARDARVVRMSDAKTGALGSSGKLIITLALASADQMLDAVHAAQVASITVVRSTLAGDTSGTRSATTGPLARSAGVR
ncbi:MAG: SAF domain-containing protein [Acidimicrobiales bacterium]